MPKKQMIQIEGRELALSNLDKILFPESGFTKGEVIAFYTECAEAILPHLQDRPLTLKRYPDGIAGGHFYEKNAPAHSPAWVKRVAVPRTEGGPDIHYVLCNDLATLVWATNLADIEKHVFLARAPDLDRPTSIVFDLDPGEPAGILDCAEVALHLRTVFRKLGLDSFAKVSGSKGIHLTVPLNSEVTYATTQPFARAIAELVAHAMPKGVVAKMAKSLRRGKVFIDWSQNSDFKTTVCVYAMRAKRREPFISMPVTWEELQRAVKRKKEDALFFTPRQALRRWKRVGDLFAPTLTLRQELPESFTDALAAGPPRKLSAWPRNSKPVRDKSLREYAAKRDHLRTPEPPARPVSKQSPNRPHRFVIQKHAASHLHYDFRLEMEGVLRSWAVPKGPPRKPKEARLAMHVEDHPLEYADFEGTIPPGNYGAGTVMVWDQGTYEDLSGHPTAAFYQGKLHIVMQGKKLHGEWILLKDRAEDRESNKWLLVKAGQELKLSRKADDSSAITGRSMEEIAAANDRQWQSNRPSAKEPAKRPRSRKRVPPAFVESMQCKPVTSLPQTGEWTWEIKFDGYRCLAVKRGRAVTLFSRNQKSLNRRFPEVAGALEQLPGDFAMDGEVVALNQHGLPSFQILQNSGSEAAPVYFYAFDLVNQDGEDLRDLPIENRRERLGVMLGQPADPIRLSPLLDASSDQITEAVRQLGLEGVVGKRKASRYEAGERSGAWIKHRLDRQQEFVIGGFVPGAHGFDALIVGIHEDSDLVYVAKVKNGFVPRIRSEIFPLLKKRLIKQCPFSNLPETKAGRWGDALTAEKMKACRWVSPSLVCQVKFVEWTEGGKLRHSAFVAMREDKDATNIARET